MDSGNTSDDDVDKKVTETNTEISNEQSLQLSPEEQNNINYKDNTDITGETQTPELEIHNSLTTYDVSQTSEFEPALNNDENLSSNNNSTSDDSNSERSSTRRNDNRIEDFLRSVEEHHVPELRWSWETHFANVPHVIINADADNHREGYSANEVELNAFVNSLTLYSINEESDDEPADEAYTYRHFSSRNTNHATNVRPTQVNETGLVPQPSVSTYDDQYLNRGFHNQSSFNPGYNENYSFVPSYLYDHPRAQQLFNNLGVQLVSRDILLLSPNNADLHTNVLLNFNYNNEVNNVTYIPELNIYRNSMLNALANENILMEELYRANQRLNAIHDQQMLDANNNQPANAVADVVEEMDLIDNIDLVHPNNVLPVHEEVPVQRRPRQLPFEQLILIANGGITPLNGQYNALIELIYSNPNLLFLNIRNIILIVHPQVLVGTNNVVFSQNHHWVSVRELLRMNTVMLNYENRNNNNGGHQEFNGEAGPSNERERDR